MFSFFQRRRADSGLIALGLQSGGVCVVRLHWPEGQRPKILASEYRPWEDGALSERQMNRLAAEFDLKHARCTTLLDESEYTLLLTEAPDVRPDELKSALRWRVKGLIDFHINDATLDAFEIPSGDGGKLREMYVIAARNEAIRRRADALQTAGINLEIIDIPEMAQRNLAALLPQDAQGVAMLSFGHRGGLLTLSRQGDLYLSRNLDVGLDQLRQGESASGYYDRVVLEVQRSLDYYESHFRQTPVQHLVLVPPAGQVPGLLEHLRSNLGVTLSAMNLSDLMDIGEVASSNLEGECLFALGAALRREEKVL